METTGDSWCLQLAARLYFEVGAYIPAHNVFVCLDVKHILVDVCSHFLLEPALDLAHFGHARGLCEVPC